MEDDGFVLVSREEISQYPCPDHVPGEVEETSNSNNFASEIDIYIESLAEPLWELNHFIHENPELAFKEYKAHQALTDYLQSREEGWHITPSACGLETAWMAVYDSGRNGPVVSFNVEMGM